MTENKTMSNKGRKTLPVLIVSQLFIAVLSGAIILVVGLKIKPLIERKVELEKIVINLENNIQDLERNINELETRIRETTVFDRNRYQLNWGNSKLLITGVNLKPGNILEDIFEMKHSGVGWKRSGYSPEVGFDSPSFAAYLLNKHNILTIDESQRYRLPELLPETDNPQSGDLIFYESGYVMFFFKDRYGHPFCIGMTPLGIASLEINFGPKLLRYGRVNY